MGTSKGTKSVSRKGKKGSAKTPAKTLAKTPPKSPAETPPKSPAESPPKTPAETPPKTPAKTPREQTIEQTPLKSAKFSSLSFGGLFGSSKRPPSPILSVPLDGGPRKGVGTTVSYPSLPPAGSTGRAGTTIIVPRPAGSRAAPRPAARTGAPRPAVSTVALRPAVPGAAPAASGSAPPTPVEPEDKIRDLQQEILLVETLMQWHVDAATYLQRQDPFHADALVNLIRIPVKNHAVVLEYLNNERGMLRDTLRRSRKLLAAQRYVDQRLEELEEAIAEGRAAAGTPFDYDEELENAYATMVARPEEPLAPAEVDLRPADAVLSRAADIESLNTALSHRAQVLKMREADMIAKRRGAARPGSHQLYAGPPLLRQFDYTPHQYETPVGPPPPEASLILYNSAVATKAEWHAFGTPTPTQDLKYFWHVTEVMTPPEPTAANYGSYVALFKKREEFRANEREAKNKADMARAAKRKAAEAGGPIKRTKIGGGMAAPGVLSKEVDQVWLDNIANNLKNYKIPGADGTVTAQQVFDYLLEQVYFGAGYTDVVRPGTYGIFRMFDDEQLALTGAPVPAKKEAPVPSG